MGYLTTAEVAKRTRADIKKALAAGELGDLPEGVKISVTSRDSLSITVKGAPDEWAWAGGNRYTPGAKTSEAARELGRKLADIARPHHAQGYDFGFVYLEDGVSLGGLGKPGWTPGQD